MWSYEGSGFGTHADYMFGWKGDSLQRAMDARCTGDICDVLDFQPEEVASKCKVPRLVPEDVDGCELPRAALNRRQRMLTSPFTGVTSLPGDVAVF